MNLLDSRRFREDRTVPSPFLRSIQRDIGFTDQLFGIGVRPFLGTRNSKTHRDRHRASNRIDRRFVNGAANAVCAGGSETRAATVEDNQELFASVPADRIVTANGVS